MNDQPDQQPQTNQQTLTEPYPTAEHDTQDQPPKRYKTRIKGRGSVFGLAMMGLAQALGMDKQRDKPVQIVNKPDDNDRMDLDYGPLESLDE